MLLLFYIARYFPLLQAVLVKEVTITEKSRHYKIQAPARHHTIVAQAHRQ
jgi:hypothetical protein